MAVNELERDYLRLIHDCDAIDNIINGMKMRHEEEPEKKRSVHGIVMQLESEILDSKYTDAGKDMTRINQAIATGRAYWGA